MPGADPAWPAPAFHFRVRIGRAQLAFAEVTGIEAAIDVPGEAVRYGRVLLRRGIFKGDLALWRWFEAFAKDAGARKTVTIDLLDETGAAMRRWTLRGAWPARVAGPDLNATANAAAIETIEIAFETMVVSAP